MREYGLDMLDLPNSGACKFPITGWGTTRHRFCGEPTEGTYCAHHAAICFEPEPPRKQRYQPIFDRNVIRRAV